MAVISRKVFACNVLDWQYNKSMTDREKVEHLREIAIAYAQGDRVHSVKAQVIFRGQLGGDEYERIEALYEQERIFQIERGLSDER
jgi:hypothetical protein